MESFSFFFRLSSLFFSILSLLCLSSLSASASGSLSGLRGGEQSFFLRPERFGRAVGGRRPGPAARERPFEAEKDNVVETHATHSLSSASFGGGGKKETKRKRETIDGVASLAPLAHFPLS